MKIHFCPSCHRRIEIPTMLTQGNIQVEKKITIKCGNCPNGKIKYMPEIKLKDESNETPN